MKYPLLSLLLLHLIDSSPNQLEVASQWNTQYVLLIHPVLWISLWLYNSCWQVLLLLSPNKVLCSTIISVLQMQWAGCSYATARCFHQQRCWKTMINMLHRTWGWGEGKGKERKKVASRYNCSDAGPKKKIKPKKDNRQKERKNKKKRKREEKPRKVSLPI